MLGDAQGAQFASKIDRNHARPAIVEGVTGVIVAVADLVERVSHVVVATETGLLPSLMPERDGLVDDGLRLKAGRRGQGRPRSKHSGDYGAKGDNTGHVTTVGTDM